MPEKWHMRGSAAQPTFSVLGVSLRPWDKYGKMLKYVLFHRAETCVLPAKPVYAVVSCGQMYSFRGVK